MVIRSYFICVFAVLINKVSLQVTGVIGGSVVLPCSSVERHHEPQDTEVHWRQNGSKIVIDIIKGKESLENQDPRYKNRAEAFPAGYLSGNFSIKLNNLEHIDAGKYICLITHLSEHKTVELKVNETQPPKPTSPYLLWLSIIPLLIVLIVVCIVVVQRKKKFSPVVMEDKRTATEINE